MTKIKRVAIKVNTQAHTHTNTHTGVYTYANTCESAYTYAKEQKEHKEQKADQPSWVGVEHTLHIGKDGQKKTRKTSTTKKADTPKQEKKAEKTHNKQSLSKTIEALKGDLVKAKFDKKDQKDIKNALISLIGIDEFKTLNKQLNNAVKYAKTHKAA